MTRLRRSERRDLPVAARPQLPPVLQRPADLAGRQLADARRPDAAGAEAHRQRRRRSGCWPRRSSVRCCSSGRGRVSSPTAPTSARCCSSCRRSRWPSRSRSPRWRSAATRRSGDLRRRARRRRHRSRSTTRPAGAFVVEMVPEDDMQNAVSLNSALMTVVAGRRPGARRPAGRPRSASAGASSLDGISYLAVLAGLLDDAHRASCDRRRRSRRGPRARSARVCGTRAACPSSGCRS